MAVLACCKKELASAVALYIIIYAVCCWHAEELGTGIFPDVVLVLLSNGTNTLLFHAIMQQQGIAGVGGSELHDGLVGETFGPVHTGDRCVGDISMSKGSRYVGCRSDGLGHLGYDECLHLASITIWLT